MQQANLATHGKSHTHDIIAEKSTDKLRKLYRFGHEIQGQHPCLQRPQIVDVAPSLRGCMDILALAEID